MKRICVLCLAACLLLGGCASLFDGSYVSTTPHQPQDGQTNVDDIQAADYNGLYAALENMAESGTQSGIIHISQYDTEAFEADMEKAVKAVLRRNPIAAYAVEKIEWEPGNHSGQRAVVVDLTYIHNRTEILKIRNVADVEEAMQMICKEVSDGSTGVVLYLKEYHSTDFVQLVEEYAFHNPQEVMETPQVTANIYPESGSSRVVELKFTYQTSRDSLRTMKNQVRPIFSSSKLYVSSDTEDSQKFSLFYTWLMGRREYKIETSITPIYSLLLHGVGDSKAFATVYAAICREAGLDCSVISGTRFGEPWYWNLVNDNGRYYHVDILRSHELGEFQKLTDGFMDGYVWNYSAYPACPDETPPETTAPTEIQPES